MPPDAAMIATAPPLSEPIASSYSAASKRRGGDMNIDDKYEQVGSDSEHKMGSGEQPNLSELVDEQVLEEYFSEGDPILSALDQHALNTSELAVIVDGNGGVGDSASDEYATESETDEDDRKPAARAQDEQIEGTEESEDRNSPPSEAPVKALHEDFDDAVGSLREATREALQLSCREQERLCVSGEELEARIAYVRKKITMVKEELLQKGALDKGVERDMRLSLVQEDDDDDELLSKCMYQDAEPDSAIQRISNSQGVLQANISSTRFSGTKSSLFGSQTTQTSKATSISDATGVPHLSRSSLLGMLGASKSWLDNYANKSFNSQPADENGEGGRDSDVSIGPSFFDGAGDGMPSRWKARERQQQRTAKRQREKEEEEQHLHEKAKDGSCGARPPSHPEKKRSEGEQLRDLVARREREIASLEERVSSAEQETSPLRDEIDTLQNDHRRRQDVQRDERWKLQNEISQVQHDNDRLDHMLVETGVSLEEKRIGIEILATELKGAREELADVQNERDRRKRERRRRERSKSWSRMRSSASSLLGGGGEEEQAPAQQQEQNQPQMQEMQQSATGSFERYQIPADAIQQYRTMASSSDEDTDYGNSGSGSSGQRGLERRRSHASVGTQMSSLTLDSTDLIDILETLELDS